MNLNDTLSGLSSLPKNPPPIGPSDRNSVQPPPDKMTQTAAFKILTSMQPLELGYFFGSDYLERVTSIDVRENLLAFQCQGQALHIFNMATGKSMSLSIEYRVNEIVRVLNKGIAIGGNGPMDFLSFNKTDGTISDISPMHNILGKFHEPVRYSEPRDDDLIAVADRKAKVLEVYDGNVQKFRNRYLGHGGKHICRGVQLQKDHVVVALGGMEGSKHMIRTYSLEDGDLLKTIAMEKEPLKLANDRDQRIAVADSDGQIGIYDSILGKRLISLKADWRSADIPKHFVFALQMSKKWVVAVLNNDKMQIWDAQSGICKKSLDVSRPLKSYPTFLVLDGDRFAVSEPARTDVEVWNCESGLLEHTFDTGSGVTALRFQNREGGTYLIAGLNDGRVKIWNAGTAKSEEQDWFPWTYKTLKKTLKDPLEKKRLAETILSNGKKQRLGVEVSL